MNYYPCPKCKTLMDGNGDCYICPEGCGEFWPDSRHFDPWLDEQRLKKSMAKPGGGSRTAGRKREKPKKFYPYRLPQE